MLEDGLSERTNCREQPFTRIDHSTTCTICEGCGTSDGDVRIETAASCLYIVEALCQRHLIRVHIGTISQHLDAGETILRFTIAGAQCNIDKVEFKLDVSDGIESLTSDVAPANNGSVYNLAGQRVADGKSKMENGLLPKGVYIVNGKKVLVR